jgi:hypothetical protein
MDSVGQFPAATLHCPNKVSHFLSLRWPLSLSPASGTSAKPNGPLRISFRNADKLKAEMLKMFAPVARVELIG